jgi:hypothetical protein
MEGVGVGWGGVGWGEGGWGGGGGVNPGNYGGNPWENSEGKEQRLI